MQIYKDFLDLKFKHFSDLFFLIFAQNIDCGYTLEPPCRGGSIAEAVLTSTHNNLCFGAKLRKIGIPLHTQVLLYKTGVQGFKGVYITRTCFHEDYSHSEVMVAPVINWLLHY